MRSVVLTAASAFTAHAALYPKTGTSNHTCVLDPAYLSCSAKANPADVDTCCVETYGGLLLATQFWDVWADKPLPENTWTLHGLWPDFCNGSYTQYCDLSRQYDPVPSPNTTNGLPNGTVVPPYNGSNIGTFLEPFGKYDLLAWMNKYWISQTGPNADFWGHEFSKHATCFSTFDVPCYGPKYQQHEEVVDFFETAIGYYQKFSTWEWLAKHGITPSNSTGYSRVQLENALAAEHGAVPYVGCSGPRYNDTAAGKAAKSTDTGRTVLSEVWYYMHVFGRPQDHRYVPVDQTSRPPPKG
ncbi:uncharacterized protein MYCFIDRAFT_189121 [Pseudocercospora fijiensis CIRAD86]|uniref:ribonuclease T2 n=1 Tax=Pseudocercospora fijiensis (strain CIRAD86) TaxID=383855 RepID=M2ZU11_PSEFD|nr:uncharacterized protein MYCFIDRAFT_189121 [Pseudocercospora fijiensis CIRAD86]EME82494.1 hypothetical protein MYCFIDRAFT_189121 [Pseudocercospora fijiensis CIRAD86]